MTDQSVQVNALTLMHYAAEPVTLDRARTYNHQPGRFKPDGLWVSVQGEDDWPSWCRSEEWGLGGLTQPHVVTLTPDANILLLDTFEGVKGLAARHPAPPESWDPLPDAKPNWQGIVARYDGILIAPYQWRARLDQDTYWYYGWDCASGCIWNLDAIADLSPTGRTAQGVSS